MPKCAAQCDRCHLAAPTSRPKASQGGLGEPLLLRVLWGNGPRRFRARLQAGYVVSTFRSAVVELSPARTCEADRSNCAPLTLVILPYLLPATSSRTRRTFLFKPSLFVCLQYRHANRMNRTRHDNHNSARLAPTHLVLNHYLFLHLPANHITAPILPSLPINETLSPHGIDS
jgi:hypothetical protein